MIVAIYQRVSTQEQVNGYSISEQKERLKDYCRALNWDIYRSYTDPGFTGASLDRPGLQALIADAKNHKIEKVVVYKLDRLSRSQLDTLYLIEKVFLANGVDFVSISESFDTATPFGRAMIGILAVFAQLEREQIKERMILGKEARAKEGKFSGSWVIPIGYDYEDGKLITNNYEKMQILKVFELFFEGIPVLQMVRLLREAGYKHKYGYWIDRTIRNVLRSKTYLGFIKYRNHWYKGTHEAFISQETHDKAVAILDQRKRDYEKNRRPGKAQSYLGGLLICTRCGAKFSKKAGYRRKDGSCLYYYACNSRLRKNGHSESCDNKFWNMDDLDDLVFGEIRKLSVDPEALIEQRKPIDSKPLYDEVKKIKKQISRLLDLYASEEMPLAEIQEKINALADRQGQLEKAIADQEQEKQTFDSAAETIRSFGGLLDTGDFQKIRTVLTTLIDRIEIDGENIVIHWNFS